MGNDNPFVNVRMEIRLDDLLAERTLKALEDSGSNLKISINKTTLRQLQTRVWDRIPGSDLMTAEKTVLTVVEALGLAIREDDSEETPDRPDVGGI